MALRALLRPLLRGRGVPLLAKSLSPPLLPAPPPPLLAHLGARALSTVAPRPPATAEPSRFAVVMLGGSQYKVAADDLICVEKLPLPVGGALAARRVLLVGEAGATVIGSPLIEGACVHAVVEEQGYGEKVIVFKKKRRKGYRRWKGYRPRLSLLRIREISLPQPLEAALSAPAQDTVQ